jgi:hypothetical protein
MAKGKHAAALFEVIHSDKRFRKKNLIDDAGRLNTPKWWFKGQRASAGSEAQGNAGNVSANNIAAGEAASEAAPASADDPTQTGIHGNKAAAPSMVALEPARNRIHFKLSYTSAIITGFAVLVVMIIAYTVGKRGLSPDLAPQSAQATEQLLTGPARPDVLHVGNDLPAPKTGDGAAARSKNDDAIETVTPAQSPASPHAPQALVVDDDKFMIGLNYVIVQSWPDEKIANDAVEALAKGGVRAKVVKGPPGWASTEWYSVIGTKGFDQIRKSKEYDAYVSKIEKIGQDFADGSRFKLFKPLAYKWRETR